MNDYVLAKLDNHPRNKNEEAMMLRMNPPIKLTVRRTRVSRFKSNTQHREWAEKSAVSSPAPVVVGRAERCTTRRRRNAHHPAKPYSLCVLVKPRNENADSPSKNWLSGITPLAASKLNHPLPGIVNFV